MNRQESRNDRFVLQMRTWSYLGMFIALLVIPAMILMEVVLAYYVCITYIQFIQLRIETNVRDNS